MNCVLQVAKLLGVELGEEFKLEGRLQHFRFVDTGLEAFNGEYWESANAITGIIIAGVYKIEKLPYEPKEGDYYISVFWDGDESIQVGPVKWTADSNDCCRKYSGNVFRTAAEAEREKYNVYERLTGKKWER